MMRIEAAITDELSALPYGEILLMDRMDSNYEPEPFFIMLRVIVRCEFNAE